MTVTLETGPKSGMAESSVGSAQNPAIAVFCGARSGTNPEFTAAARALAKALHAQQWRLVYGAGTVGMMGEVSKALVELSGPQAVHGIIPEALVAVERQRNPDARDKSSREHKYGLVTVVKDMHERKALMAKEASAFVALPGGFGTMEELMEIITWNLIGIHAKPIVIFNVDGYYDDLISWIGKAVSNGFVDEKNKNIVLAARTAQEVIECIKGYEIAAGRYTVDWSSK